MTINVYCAQEASFYNEGVDGIEHSADLLVKYIEPLNKNLPEWYRDSHYRKCPAATNVIKQCYVIPLYYDINFSYSEHGLSSNDNRIIDFTGQSLAWSNQSIGPHQIFNNVLLFADKPLTVTTLHPYLHVNEFTRNFNVLTAEYDIGKWCRPINTAFINNYREGNVNIKKGDIVSYIRFNTTEKIKIHTFTVSSWLRQQVYSATNMVNITTTVTPLEEVYRLFRYHNLRNRILKDIKENTI